MPELPEVETTRSGIEPLVQKQRINEVIIRQWQLRWPIPTELPSLLQQRSIIAVHRRAKYLLFEFSHGHLIAHLGMSGSFRVVEKKLPLLKHDHVDLCFENDLVLRYHDPRRFGSLHWVDAATPLEQHFLLNKLGPEPLTEAFTGELLYQRAKSKKQAVKTFLMDNSNVVGVGNIYASEALFVAGIDPRRAAGRISIKRYQNLTTAVKEVLAASIKQGGTTLRDFTQADGKPGYFRQQLRVYERETEPCLNCKQPIQRIVLGQRASYFCPQCQR